MRGIAALVLAGVALRAALLAAALPLGIQADEANYLYGALALERFGFQLDHYRFLWPPGYVWWLAQLTGPDGLLGLGGGAAGIDAARVSQVVASALTGTFTSLFAWRLFSARAALVAGALWAFHLPLASYTHFLFAESLFLPPFLGGLWFLLLALDRLDAARPAGAHLVLSGLAFGAALHLKEFPLFLVPLLGLLVAVRALRQSAGWVEALRRGSLVPLVAFTTLLPWSLRCAEVYGQPVLAGATLGENVYGGLNAATRNFDYRALSLPRMRAGLDTIEGRARPLFAPPAGDPAVPPAWPRIEESPHTLRRQAQNTRRGLAFAAEHPGHVARTRMQRLADWVTPFSFTARHLALGHYPEESSLSGTLRRPVLLLSSATSIVVLLGGLLGALLTLRRGAGRAVALSALSYALATAGLVSMSRFRVPVEPVLIALAAGFIAHGATLEHVPGGDAGPRRSNVLRVACGAAGALALGFLWWVTWPQFSGAFAMAWHGGVE
ncbi:MAG: hypothetical protein AAFP86_05110 [Planctomycetota bacterium]